MSENESKEEMCKCGHPKSDHAHFEDMPPRGSGPGKIGKCTGLAEDMKKCICEEFIIRT